MLNTFAVHTNPRYWGNDSMIWRPSRWIISSSPTTNASANNLLKQETLLEPEKGVYFPWSSGARACVGKKFSQVEFVAVMATLFSRHRVHPVVRAGESSKTARQRVTDIIEDSLLRMTLQVRNPSLASVSWKAV